MAPITAVSPTVKWNISEVMLRHDLRFFTKGCSMVKQERLRLYLVDIKDIRDLARVVHNVLSVSPQIHKSSRPFIGIVVICENKYSVL